MSRPIIIGVDKDGKVDMTLDEFRKHMDAAYSQGYNDSSSALTVTYAGNSHDKYWRDIYCNVEETATACNSAAVAGIGGNV